MKARAVVIDDSGFERAVEEALIQGELYPSEIAVAKDLHQGAQALWRLCAQPPDATAHLVILATCFKSGASGYRLLAFMQGHERLRRLPVIMYGRSFSPPQRYFAYELGARFCLDGSADVYEIARVLWRALPAQRSLAMHWGRVRR